ncbi:hypothetical protein [Phyllobacterium lublinensis]|uniref:hypothetical protein n=1 Tax=Phyllobacterium lublinensis TaxID=2875708 RepID=UPI001CCD62DB|nr:hypothetical protein [Phyllobacterium sp. 2063]MBZ9654666.1 hypothetical protein [Phyllobacterium sp. 2063]
MRSHITIAVLLVTLIGAAGCATSHGAQHSPAQTTNGGSSSPGGTGGTGGGTGGGY